MRLIDADALKATIKNSAEYQDYEFALYADSIMADLVDNAPEFKELYIIRHGKWEQTEVEGGKIYVCSECSEAIYKSTFEENVHYYCNNCGAKMDKE